MVSNDGQQVRKLWCSDGRAACGWHTLRVLLLAAAGGAQEMRTWKQAEDAGKAVGFDLVWSQDLAISSVVCSAW